MNVNASPPVDFEAAINYFDGDRDFMYEMFGDFQASLPQRLEEIRVALKAGSPDMLRKSAHTLKGAALTFCAGPVSEIALQIELDGRNGDMTNMSASVALLEKEVTRLLKYLADNLPR